MNRYFFRLDWFAADFVIAFEAADFHSAHKQAVKLFEGERPLYHSQHVI